MTVDYTREYLESGNKQLDDVRISAATKLVQPDQLRSEYSVSSDIASNINDYRSSIAKMMHGEDDRLLVVVGPCSIHDVDAGIEYAHKLKKKAEQYSSQLFIVMRVYFEKPRTSVGWKGLINDPHLDNSFDVNSGLAMARKLLLDIAEIGLPSATEFLDPIGAQYISDLVSWGCIGARTTESQLHRELASALSCPMGFKNATSGDYRVAINAMMAARQSHCFMSTTRFGHISLFQSSGNKDCHLVLRGGTTPNYSQEHVDAAGTTIKSMLDGYMASRVLVDASHANSNKDYRRQIEVVRSVTEQYNNGSPYILGVMLESFLKEGRQDIGPRELEYGKSITDACISFEQAEECFELLAQSVEHRRNRVGSGG